MCSDLGYHLDRREETQGFPVASQGKREFGVVIHGRVETKWLMYPRCGGPNAINLLKKTVLVGGVCSEESECPSKTVGRGLMAGTVSISNW